MGPARRKTGRLPPSFYRQQREELAAQGKTGPNSAANTTKSLNSVLKKWGEHCRELEYDPRLFLKEAQVPDFKIFWKWTLDRYKRVDAASSLNNYWRVLKMHLLDKADRDFDQRERRDIRNYINLLIKQYSLRTLPKKKPVIGLDDLYLLLYTHWALDDATFTDERQRVQVATGILAAVFFGCRPCSLFDTRVKFDDSNDSDEPLGPKALASARNGRMDSFEDKVDGGHDTETERNRDIVMAMDSGCEADSDPTKIYGIDSDSDSDNDNDNDSDSDSDSSSVYADDRDSDTDDDCDAGPEETRSFLYRHFTIIIVANGTPGKPNLVFMKATLLHTKGEDNTRGFVDGEDDDPLFSLLDHLISLALYDDAFEAKSAKTVENMFWVKMPPGKKSLTLKWKRDALNLPVFREKLRGVAETGTSPKEPLRAGTWISYLKRLGEKAGFQHSFTQYGLRRGLLNVINNKAPASVRDQTFDHQQGAVGYYLDQEVRFDTKACCLGRPSNEVVQKMARLASLTADASAPTELSAEQKAKLAIHPKVTKLRERNKALTERIRRAGYRAVKDAQGTSLFKKKKRAEARLNATKKRLRIDMIAQARKRHFRKADTITFDAQFSAEKVSYASAGDTPHAKPFTYNIPERAEVVRLVCSPGEDLTDRQRFRRRIQAIEVRTALCHRREAQRRGRPKVIIKPEESEGVLDDSDEGMKIDFPMVCRPTQCPFCLGNESLPYHHRVYEYAKPHQMMNEAGKHLKRFAPADEVPCPHPMCKTAGLVLPSIVAFKNHTAMVHKIFLRA
ncbi:MAG: hypothetical protein Q9177_001280 [Variospora cf. flavescens]